MGILGKKRGADIDFTLLQKKGLMKKSPVAKRTGWKVDKSGFIEMPDPTAALISNGSENTNAVPNPNSGIASGFGFLESMVEKQGLGSVDPNPLQGFFDNPSGMSPPTPPSLDNDGKGSDFSSLKVKLDDLEYKLERLIERLDQLESSK
ncbi:MAG: hypothetical protein Q8Q31_04495 [Nanoarchaeota archaeon]|nr:hypothetical protein [Nanoarchaeota archaeon]